MANIRDETELMDKALAGDTDARNKLILMMKDLLYQMASQMKLKVGVDVDDLVNEAIVKIIKEFHRFKPNMGLSPLTYFGVVAWRKMQSYLDTNEVMRVPDRWSYKATTAPYVTRALHTVDFANIEAIADASVQNAENSFSMEEIIADHREVAPFKDSCNRELVEAMKKSMACLTPDQREVINGLLKGHNLAYIGKEIGVCRERARQLRNDAYVRMKKWIVINHGESL